MIRSIPAAILIALALAAPSHAAAKGTAAKSGAISSAYTKLDLDKCKTVEEAEEWTAWKCSGYANIPLYVELGDGRFDLDAGVFDKDQLWSDTFDHTPETVEWRTRGGKPFAIIYRLTVANPDVPKTSRLIVETIGTEAKPGCRIADIPGSTPDANGVAREVADEVLKGFAECIGI